MSSSKRHTVQSIVRHRHCPTDVFPIGKTTFFVANQAKLDTVPAEKLAVLEEEQKQIDEENKVLVAELKSANSGARRCWCICLLSPSHSTLLELTKIRASPSNVELSKQIAELTEAVNRMTSMLCSANRLRVRLKRRWLFLSLYALPTASFPPRTWPKSMQIGLNGERNGLAERKFSACTCVACRTRYSNGNRSFFPVGCGAILRTLLALKRRWILATISVLNWTRLSMRCWNEALCVNLLARTL